MKKKSKSLLPAHHPALVDSSYTVFFMAFALLWAHIFSAYFPPTLQWRAFLLSFLFAFMVYVFRFVVLQFYDGVSVLRMIVAYYVLSAVMVFASAVRGVIADGQIPVIHIIFFGPTLYTFSGPAALVASVVPFYGSVTLAAAAVCAEIAEFIYNKSVGIMPKFIHSGLTKADHKVDVTAVEASDSIFILSDWKGVVAALSLLAGYGILYMLLLIV
jgi:hypothetical protein